MVKDGLAVTNPDSGQSAFDNLLGIGNGNSGMTIDTSRALGTIEGSARLGGSIRTSSSVSSPMPGPTGKGGVLVGGGALFIVNKSSPAKQAAAWQYLKFLNEPESQAIWAAGTGYVPIRKSAAASKTMTDFWAANPLFKVAYDQLLAGADNPAGVGAVMGPPGGERHRARRREHHVPAGRRPEDCAERSREQGRRRDQGLQHADRRVTGLPRLIGDRFGTSLLLGRVTDGLDVVAIGIAHERAVVTRVVLGPEPRLVQHLRAACDGSVEEGAHRGAVGRDERNVRFAESVAGGTRADPEVGLGRHAEPDDVSEIHDPNPAERARTAS